jgi:methionine sulfoxide reductase heme-binding subunit
MLTTLKSWRLFWVLVVTTSIAVGVALPGVDFHSDRSVEALILRTILCALPWLIAAFMASSLARLRPGPETRWLLANRRYVGLAFAAGMTWHFTFVGYFFWAFGNRLTARDLALDLIGFMFLGAMTVTSFPKFRQMLSPARWRQLHTTGIYTLWFLPTFFFLDDVVRERDLFDALAVGVLLSVLAVRLAGRARVRKSASIGEAG